MDGGGREEMKSKRNLFMIPGVQLQECQRQLDADSNPVAATGKRGQLRGWEAQTGNPFATLQLKHWKGGTMEGRNYSGAQAISHRESRPDTAASIIHMTTVNEQDPNKSPLNSLGEN